MRYLGGLSGSGTLTGDGSLSARADYDFDGFLTKPDVVTGSGEIHLDPEILKKVFGHRTLDLLTDDGLSLRVRFSGKQLRAGSDVAHVEVSGALPPLSKWPPPA